jgi:hypothetical protein
MAVMDAVYDIEQTTKAPMLPLQYCNGYENAYAQILLESDPEDQKLNYDPEEWTREKLGLPTKKPQRAKTMTVEEACKLGKLKFNIGTSGHEFTEVEWVNPHSTSGNVQTGILVTIEGKTAIEVNRHGVFLNAFPASADYYRPRAIKGTGKAEIRAMIKALRQELKK